MKFTFGNAFICEDADIARRLYRDARLRRFRFVTLDGDIYDPAGVLVGGSAPENKLLKQMKDVSRLEQEMQHGKNKINDLTKEVAEARRKTQEYLRLKGEIESGEQELKILKERMEGDLKETLQNKVRHLDEDLSEANRKLETLRDFEKKYQGEVEQMETQIEDFKKKRKLEKEVLEEREMQLREEVEKAAQALKSYQKEFDRLEYTGEENEKDLQNSKAQLQKEKEEKV